MVPDHYAWTILTAGEADHYLFDGSTVRAFVGERQVGAEPGANSALRTLARFTAVTNLDVLALPGVRVAPLAHDELPAGAREGLAVVLADDGSRYRLGFDARTLVVHAEGPVALPPRGSGQLVARFTDFRRAGRWLLPYRTEYTFAGQALAVERALAVCPDPPRLEPAAFHTPAALPECPPRLSDRTAPSPGSRTASRRWR